MSRVFFISDLHFHHKRILEFSPTLRDGDSVLEHDHILVTRWNSVVRKKTDLVFVLGDVAMDADMSILSELNGRKKLCRGNHDLYPLNEYLKYFEDVLGIFKYKHHWCSHAPIHPAELRGCPNIHGHVHSNSIRDAYGERDKRYINVCCEVNRGYPIPFDDIKDGTYWGYTRC